MIELPTGLRPELVPLSWLLGVWEGTGVVAYRHTDPVPGADEAAGRVEYEIRQRVSFSHDGLACLNYSATTWLLGADETPLSTEVGFWRIARLPEPGDTGPGLLIGEGALPFGSAQAVEALRQPHGGFDIEAAIVHPDGITELYVGRVNGPRIDLATDAVVRSTSARPYTGATRLFGLVEGHLLWAWDIAANGNDLRTHASARLAKVD